jgi:hypothetical protein
MVRDPEMAGIPADLGLEWLSAVPDAFEIRGALGALTGKGLGDRLARVAGRRDAVDFRKDTVDPDVAQILVELGEPDRGVPERIDFAGIRGVDGVPLRGKILTPPYFRARTTVCAIGSQREAM